MNPILQKTLAAAWAAVRRYGWLPITVFLIHEFCSHVIDAYRRWPPIDIPLHFLGGLAMAFFLAGALRLFTERGLFRPPEPLLRLVLLFALVGTTTVFWEFAEWISDHYFGTNCQMNDLNDTLLDQLMGLSGAFAFLLPRLPAALQRYFHPASKPAP